MDNIRSHVEHSIRFRTAEPGKEFGEWCVFFVSRNGNMVEARRHEQLLVQSFGGLSVAAADGYPEEDIVKLGREFASKSLRLETHIVESTVIYVDRILTTQ